MRDFLKKLKEKKYLWLAFYLFIFSYLLFNSFTYLDPDLGWHLKVGEQIASEKTVPTLDYYDFTREGSTWVDHEWLSNLIIFIIFTKLGYIVLSVFFVLIMVIALFLLHCLVHLNSEDKCDYEPFLAVFFLLGLIAMRPHLGVRIQEVTALLLIIVLIILFDFQKKKNFRFLFFLPLLFIIWACLHAGFLIGLFTLFVFWAIKVGEFFYDKYKMKVSGPGLSLKQLALFAIISLVSLLATFLTPYGLGLYSFLIGYSNPYYLTHLAEWLPQYYLPIAYWQLLFMGILATALLLYIISFRSKKIVISYFDSIMSIIFLALAFKSHRNFPLLFFVSLPFMIVFYASSLAGRSSVHAPARKSHKPSSAFLLLAQAMSALAVLVAVNFTGNPFFSYSNFPSAAVRFLQKNPSFSDQLFAPYDWGGYLVWTLPQKKLFIDGRVPQVEFAGHTMLEEYDAFFDKDKTAEKIDQYGIRLILADAQGELTQKPDWFEINFLGAKKPEPGSGKDVFINYLENNRDWTLVYQDNISKIFARE